MTILVSITLYSAFANSCPLQTDAFLFPLIHSHNVLLSSNQFKYCNERLGRQIPGMEYPHEVTFKVKLAIIQTRVFSHLKGTHIHVFLYNICRIYMSYHILFERIYFVLSYSTHIWNAY